MSPGPARPNSAAFLRGVSPTNCKMPALKAALEAGGFGQVKTVLSSGNAVFFTTARSEDAVRRKVEAALQEGLGRTFDTYVRSIEALRALLEEDPFARFRLPEGTKRVVTFLHEAPAAPPQLPVERRGARLLALRGREALTVYVPTPGDPAFMSLIEDTLGRELTTRTWDTVKKVVAAAS
jgi:uncharacterized protein (DUF1697 family)